MKIGKRYAGWHFPKQRSRHPKRCHSTSPRTLPREMVTSSWHHRSTLFDYIPEMSVFASNVFFPRIEALRFARGFSLKSQSLGYVLSRHLIVFTCCTMSTCIKCQCIISQIIPLGCIRVAGNQLPKQVTLEFFQKTKSKKNMKQMIE